jgi:hypothetical protein
MADKWKVTSIRQETQLSEGNDSFRPVFKVGYQVTDGPAEGTRGHVIIPAAEYEPDTVNDAITRIVESHQKISNL